MRRGKLRGFSSFAHFPNTRMRQSPILYAFGTSSHLADGGFALPLHETAD